MADITSELMTNFDPVQAVIVYKVNGYGFMPGESYYLESRDIQNGKMSSGKPLTKDTIANMVEFFHQDSKKESFISGIVPDNLLACDYGPSKKVLIWYRLPERRPMSFTKELHIKNGIAAQPGLIYIVNNGNLDIMAFKGNQRPNGETLLFCAPYHNTASDGSVCLGSAKVKKPTKITYQNVMAYYELLFWGSEFSHLHGNESPVKGNLNTFWKSAIGQKAPFDEDILIDMTGNKKVPLKFINVLNTYFK